MQSPTPSDFLHWWTAIVLGLCLFSIVNNLVSPINLISFPENNAGHPVRNNQGVVSSFLFRALVFNGLFSWLSRRWASIVAIFSFHGIEEFVVSSESKWKSWRRLVPTTRRKGALGSTTVQYFPWCIHVWREADWYPGLVDVRTPGCLLNICVLMWGLFTVNISSQWLHL